MKRSILIIFIILIFRTGAFSQVETDIELKAINDVLSEILQMGWPSNPYEYIKSMPPPPPPPGFEKYKIDSASWSKSIENQIRGLDTTHFSLYLTDTLFSLKDIIKGNKWLYKNVLFEPMYQFLIKSKNFKTLDNKIIDKTKFTNIWKYSIVNSISDLEKPNIYPVNMQLSRVCFNNDHTLGFFYVSVQDNSYSGYVTLILITHKKNPDRWEIADGTYYH